MWEYPPGSKAIDPDEAVSLIPQHITTQKQLNEWEQSNILTVEHWLTNKRFCIEDVVTTHFVKHIHVKMFDKTWRWAGHFRNTNKNIGVDWFNISVELRNLLDDIQYQIEHGVYGKDELATRFHHRLVAIHPFSNGNGRHARMMTDIFLLSLGSDRFTWGHTNLTESSKVRANYIAALRAADAFDYSLLQKFVRE